MASHTFLTKLYGWEYSWDDVLNNLFEGIVMNYLIGLCVFVLSACGHTVSDDGSTYQVLASQTTFAVTLQSNATTGYQWFAKQYDHSLLTLSSSHYLPPTNTKRMGAPGQIVFNFIIKPGVARPKSAPIQFVYKRPWEPNTGTEKTVTINFQ